MTAVARTVALALLILLAGVVVASCDSPATQLDADTYGELAAPSPAAGAPRPHEFYGVTPIPPPMPADPPAGKRAGSLSPAKAAGGPVAKEL